MKVEFHCNYCNKKCVRPYWEYKRTKYHFCSQSCAKSHKNRFSKPLPSPGDKSHNLTFIKSVFENKKTYLVCKCDCGEFTRIKRNKFGVTKTCNNRGNHKGKESSVYKGHEEISRTYWNSLKHGAKERELSFNITIEEAWDLYQKQERRCALSGVTLNLNKNYNKQVTASLDRKNSEYGYEIDNIQWIHKDLNIMKNNYGDSEFVDWCTRIANYRGLIEKLDFNDVLIKPRKSKIKSRNDVNLSENLINDILPDTIPIIAANFDTVGSFNMAKSLGDLNVLTCLHKHYKSEEYISFFKHFPNLKNKVFYSIGSSDKDLEKLKCVYNECGINNICLDVANAYIPQVADTIVKIKNINKNFILMVGNIATSDIIEDFYNYGVNILKVGIGSGGVCTTRIVAGVGIPQLSCILDCVNEAEKYNIKICSDGGCRMPADIVKAFAAGSSMVMIGSMLSGHEECDGEWEIEDGIKKRLVFYGMSSKNAMEKHYGEVSNYRASEGRVTKIDYKGPVKHTINEILGGIRSACSYVGASSLKEFNEKATFIRCNKTHDHNI